MTKFYLVGGAVRDKLLGMQVKDFDYAVEASSYDVMKKAIEDRGGQIFLETPKFFTIRAKVPKLGVADYVLCRKESSYSDGRHPDKVEIGTLYDDLARRDFTINAMAQEEGEGPIIDPFGGQKDLEKQLLRCVGVARDRFDEDHLRILRAIRFSITKNLILHEDIRSCISSGYIDKLKSVSVDRIREELHKILSFNTAYFLDMVISYPHIVTIFDNFPQLWLKPTTES